MWCVDPFSVPFHDRTVCVYSCTVGPRKQKQFIFVKALLWEIKTLVKYRSYVPASDLALFTRDGRHHIVCDIPRRKLPRMRICHSAIITINVSWSLLSLSSNALSQHTAHSPAHPENSPHTCFVSGEQREECFHVCVCVFSSQFFCRFFQNLWSLVPVCASDICFIWLFLLLHIVL